MFRDFLNEKVILKRITLQDTGFDEAGNPVAQPVRIETNLGTIRIRMNQRPTWRISDSGFVEAGGTKVYSDSEIRLGDVLEIDSDNRFEVVKVYRPKGLYGSPLHHWEAEVVILNQ